MKAVADPQGGWPLAVVSVFGSTEEGSLDDLPSVHALLDRLHAEHGVTVWRHVDAAYGGYLPTMLRANLDDPQFVSVEALKYLRHFQRSTYAVAQRARPGVDVRTEVEALLQRYITYLLERALNSPDFIRQIKR